MEKSISKGKRKVKKLKNAFHQVKRVSQHDLHYTNMTFNRVKPNC